MSKINKVDTNGVKPLLGIGELGYDNYPAGGDAGRVWVGTGTENIPLAKETEVTAVDAKVNTHTAKVDNPHAVTKAQVGLGNADNTADASKNVLSATKLTTARTIGGVSFDGTANINLPGVNTAGNQNTTGNAATATKLQTARTIALSGDVTGSVSFNGSANVSITTTVADDSHNHVISNVDGLQNALDSKAPLESPIFTGTPKIGTDNIASTSTAVTDNAVARYDGTTGKLQNSGVTIDDSGNVGIGVSNPLKPLQVKEIGLTYTDNVRCVHSIKAEGVAMEFRAQATRTLGNNVFSWISIDEKELFVAKHSGDLLLTSGTGALGYGAGAGGTVTQLTSKSTSVTLNRPSGRINMHNETLAGGATVSFKLNNSLLSVEDGVIVTNNYYGSYSIRVGVVINGAAYIYITNTGTTSQSQSFPIQFQVIKGSNT